MSLQFASNEALRLINVAPDLTTFFREQLTLLGIKLCHITLKTRNPLKNQPCATGIIPKGFFYFFTNLLLIARFRKLVSAIITHSIEYCYNYLILFIANNCYPSLLIPRNDAQAKDSLVLGFTSCKPLIHPLHTTSYIYLHPVGCFLVWCC